MIHRAADLHALPVVAFEAQELIRDQRTSAQDLAKLLSKDPALATRVLKLANSSFYGFQKRIGNLPQAIVVLGFQSVKNLTFTVGVIEKFRPDSAIDSLDYPTFWAHGIATAIAAEKIARNVPGRHTSNAYMAGLLHDIGKLVLVQNAPSLHREVLGRISEGLSLLEAEREVLGRDHAELGARFLQRWNLPVNLIESIASHHAVESPQGEVALCEVVQLADLLINALGIGHSNTELPPIMDKLSERLGYDESTLHGWIAEIATSLEAASEFFELFGYGPVVYS